MAGSRGERALIAGALSRFYRSRYGFLFFFALLVPPGAGLASVCALDRPDETARVASVHDGDTLRLEDGRRLRLIGLDTPELGRHGRPDQPMAVAARDVLRRRLPPGTLLRLRFDSARVGSHGRTLAHGFFADGASISAWLLEQGLATLLIIPPSRAYADCYAAAARRAREQGLGLWSLPAFRTVDSANLPRAAGAYRVVRGIVRRMREGRDALWLHLDGRVAVRVHYADLPDFDSVPLRELAGREVTVRGRVYAVGDELRIKLRHPADIDWRGDE